MKKAEDNLYDPDTALTIHITRFGKFVPNKARMNRVRENNQKRKENIKNVIQENGSI